MAVIVGVFRKAEGAKEPKSLTVEIEELSNDTCTQGEKHGSRGKKKPKKHTVKVYRKNLEASQENKPIP